MLATDDTIKAIVEGQFSPCFSQTSNVIDYGSWFKENTIKRVYEKKQIFTYNFDIASVG